MTNDRIIKIKAAVTAAISCGTALFGWVGWVVLIWLCAMLLDYATGSLAAIYRGEWSSAAARAGLWHKAGSIAAVLVAALCDIALGVIAENTVFPLPELCDCIVTPAVAIWYIFTELGSVIENADRLGAPMPEFLKQHLKSLREHSEKAGDGK